MAPCDRALRSTKLQSNSQVYSKAEETLRYYTTGSENDKGSANGLEVPTNTITKHIRQCYTQQPRQQNATQ